MQAIRLSTVLLLQPLMLFCLQYWGALTITPMVMSGSRCCPLMLPAPHLSCLHSSRCLPPAPGISEWVSSSKAASIPEGPTAVSQPLLPPSEFHGVLPLCQNGISPVTSAYPVSSTFFSGTCCHCFSVQLWRLAPACIRGCLLCACHLWLTGMHTSPALLSLY